MERRCFALEPAAARAGSEFQSSAPTSALAARACFEQTVTRVQPLADEAQKESTVNVPVVAEEEADRQSTMDDFQVPLHERAPRDQECS
jgi:hypothetical protein